MNQERNQVVDALVNKIKPLLASADELQERIVNLICNECKARNVGGMIFHDLPAYKTYTIQDGIHDIYEEVVGFMCHEFADGSHRLYFMTEDDLDEMQADELSEGAGDNVFFTPEHVEEVVDYFMTSIEDSLTPTDTLLQLLYTFTDMVSVMEDNGIKRLTESIKLEDLRVK